jgi:hypothetical protein
MPSVSNKGYVYAPLENPGAMAGAAPGVCVRNADRGPPWIVVDHGLQSVIVSKWPGRLWRVEIIDRVSDADLRSAGQSPLRADAPYTRAVAVDVLEEAPVAALFGAHGAAVCEVIAAAGEVDLDGARRLAAARPREAADAYSRAWATWLAREDLRSRDRIVPEGTLAVPTGRSRSPIESGLGVVYGQLFRRARAVCGDAATVSDEDDTWLAEPWNGAAAALLDAALAFGAPDVIDDADREILTRAWRDVLGPAPASG